MKQNFLYTILMFLFCLGIVASFLNPAYTNILGLSIILLSLAFALYAIFQKHKGAQNPRFNISKDILILVITILLIIFLSGVVALLTNHYVSQGFGVVAGLICAILVSFAVGYWVRKAVAKLQF